MRKPASFYFFKRKPVVRKERYECWRGVADLLGLTTQERLRVEWMVFYYTAGKENVGVFVARGDGPSSAATRAVMEREGWFPKH